MSEVDEIEDQEREADAFAGFFLMPDSVFSKEWDGSEGLPFLDRVLKSETHLPSELYDGPLPPCENRARRGFGLG